MKKVQRVFLTGVITAALSLSLCLAACADYPSVTVTLQPNDTVLAVCQRMGLDYNACKDAIISLNGFTTEAQLSTLQAGSQLVLPMSDEAAWKPELISGDSVAYYVMPYLVQRGDTLCVIYQCWGMNFNNYSDDIKALNSLYDLDDIQAGQLLLLPTDAANLMGNDYTTVIAHTMKARETAYDVCRSYGLDLEDDGERLMLFNSGLDLERLSVGATLKIFLK